ncbi:MAG TPA: VOC family protein [Pseudonocardia sp.]|jgi:catechol 2,3-dioxygenase-like lactoylglutathione lyase family enzyme|nr:VOC family protein [Pseudonocardia sp.]
MTATPVPSIEPVIDTTVYPMPMFVRAEVADLERSRRFYTEALDFIELAAIPGPDGTPVLVHLRRWRHQDILIVPARGEVRAGTGLGVAVAAEPGSLAGLAERARAAGAAVVGPADTAWNTTDVTVTDPDGLPVTYTAPRWTGRNADFDDMMKDLPTAGRPDS